MISKVANETSGVRRIALPAGQTAKLYCPKKSFENYPGWQMWILFLQNYIYLLILTFVSSKESTSSKWVAARMENLTLLSWDLLLTLLSWGATSNTGGLDDGDDSDKD